jgi:hypothetical protein
LILAAAILRSSCAFLLSPPEPENPCRVQRFLAHHPAEFLPESYFFIFPIDFSKLAS